MGEDKEALKAKLDELKPVLQRTLDRERADVVSQGKPFDFTRWALGEPIDQKYPGGPPYVPNPGKPTLFQLVGGVSASDWGYTALCTTFIYSWGYQYNRPIFKCTGHKLGLMAAWPMFALGVSNGLYRSMLRYHGYLPNGNGSVYPGYKTDKAPYQVKHKVSDRYVVAAVEEQEPILMLTEEQHAQLRRL